MLMDMFLTIKDVDYLGNHSLRCTFSTGEVKDVDMTPLLDAPAFRELKDVNRFRRFGLDETIFWENGADIAPEWLYDHGVTYTEA